jgi:hypothetical protein
VLICLKKKIPWSRVLGRENGVQKELEIGSATDRLTAVAAEQIYDTGDRKNGVEYSSVETVFCNSGPGTARCCQ